ncbi:MAG: phage tail tape measure protein [Chloroflexi bacterium OLB13]|nr:MAG: phage tail tape measure protein [Chloroflexi bacterium OLB13]
MASRLQIIIEGVDKASGPIDDVTGSLGRLEKGSGSLLERGLSPLRDMLGFGLKAAAAGTAGAIGGLVAGIGVSTKAAMGMEQGVADIASVMRLTKDETSEVKDLITDLGVDPTLKVSATEAAAAIEMLGKNGLTLDDILGGAARSTVLLANATGADFATSADVATDAMALFGLGANQMEKAVAGIVGVTQSSKFGLEEYKFALANAAPVLATMGVSFDEFNAALTLSASSFASGMTAGTSWRYMIQNLVPGTDKAAQLMKELNFIAEDGTNIFFDSTGQLKSLDEIINLLKYGFRDLSTEQRTSYARAIFGQEALGALNAALEMNVETLADLVKNQSDVNSLNDAAETRMNTLAGAWEILEGIIDTLRIQIGEHFLPIWRDLVERFTAFLDEHGPQIVEWAGNLAEGLGELIDTYLPPFIAKLGEWWTAAGNIADTAGGMLTWTGGLLAWMREAIQPAVDFVREYVSLEDVLRGIGIVISAIVIPWLGGLISAWGPVFLVLAGAIGAVSLLRNAWEGDWGGIQGIVAGALNYLDERFGLLLTAIQVFGPGACKRFGRL